MKPVTMENIFNHEKFICENLRDVQVIDDVEYLIVHRIGQDRKFLMRKDTLKKLEKTVDTAK